MNFKYRYKEIEGNLLSMFELNRFDFIAHGCNCFKSMSGGIAKQIAETYPLVARADENDPRRPVERLGDFSMITINKKSILNLYTQLEAGPDLDYNALALCLKKVNLMFSGQRIGLPLIGCGIGGGDWKRVKPIIQEQLKSMDVTVVHYK